MVECLYVSQHGPSSLRGSQESLVTTRDEHTLKLSELNLKSTLRVPRRTQTTHDYQFPTPSPSTTLYVYVASAKEPESSETSSDGGSMTGSCGEESGDTSPVSTSSTTQKPDGHLPRPRLGVPRRSYSVMNYEPIPDTHIPSTTLTLANLPGEIHMAIFDHLDPIDSTCLGLTNNHFYGIHRRMHGKVPLSARRSGPNDMERVWYMSQRSLDGSRAPTEITSFDNAPGSSRDLAMLRVRGQALCRKCGIYRCELHKHLQEWMPKGFEYCTVREKFGPAAPDGSKDHCYRSSPKNPHACGRHRVQKTKLARS